MSRRASRSSVVGDQGDFYVDCKAAYLTYYDSLKDVINSKEELDEVLQLSGRNLTSRLLGKYWTSGTDELNFDDFMDICRKEKVTTLDDLMKAFRRIDINGDGHISFDELYKIMNKGEKKMSRSEVREVFDEADINSDGKIDYKEFSKMFQSTSDECKQWSRKVMEKKERKKKKEDKPKRGEGSIGSQTSLRSTASHKSERPLSASVRSTTSSKKLSDEPVGTKDDDKVDDKEEDKRGLTASRVSLASNKSASVRSKSDKVEEDPASIRASRASLKSNKSVKSEKAAKDVEITASRASLRSNKSNQGKTLSEEVPEGVDESPTASSVKGAEAGESDDSADEIIISSSRKVSNSRRSSRSSQKDVELATTPKKRISDGGMFGSFASVKSVGSRSLLSVEDLPRPSPRGVKTGKGKNTPVNRQKLAEPSNLREWTHISRKGMFYLEEEDNNIISHQYTLELTESSKVWVTIKPTTCKSLALPEGSVDTAVFIIRNKPDIRGNYLEAFSLHKDSKGKQGIKCDLDAGTYHIIPFTTGCRLRKRTSEPSKVQKLLIEKDDGTYNLSKAFKRALEDIFELADVDSNGYMSRDDFNWYNIRTSDEDVGDDEWEVVEERLELHDGEITKRGFIQLNELEAEESKGDEDDMWVTLESMGFNKELQMDEAAPFLLDVYSENCDDMEVNVAGINPIDPGSGTLLAEKAYKAVCQSVMEKGEKAKIKDMKDLYLYTYTGEGRATIMVENKSHSNIRLELDCSDSRNALSNQSSMEETFTAKSKSQMIAYHFVPEDDSTDWSIRCTESIRK